MAVYRRLEARGEIRGGREPPRDTLIVLSAADPLNLLGIVTPGARLPAVAGNRFALKDGVPVAMRVAGQVVPLAAELDPSLAWKIETALRRDAGARQDDLRATGAV